MSQAFDKVKYGAKLTASAAFSFLKINVVGLISTLLVVLIAVGILIDYCIQQGNGGAGSSIVGLIFALFGNRPLASTLTVFILFGSPFALFSLGNKYILSKTANTIINDKGEDLLYPLVDRVLDKVKQRQPELLNKGADEAKLKLKMLQEVSVLNDNKWVKRIMTFGLNKVHLGDIDFSSENLSFTDIIKTRFVNSLSDISKPSKTFFWTILGLQWFVLLLIYLKMV